MADVSNKTVYFLLIAAVAVSLIGTLSVLYRTGGPGATGFVTNPYGTGVTNFTINSSLSIAWTNATVPFGAGYVNDSFNNCHMGTNGTPPAASRGCVNFNTTVHTQNLTIENNGNIRANVSINFTANATNFIGGTVGGGPVFQYRVYAYESGSCATIGNGTSFYNVGVNETQAAGARVCTNLNYTDASDMLGVGFFLVIPKDATPGAHSVTLTAIACDDGGC